MPNHLVPLLKRGKAEGREKFPRRNKYRVLYNLLITTKITCPRGEIGRHKGLKILALWECQFESGRGHQIKTND